eukprot:12910983-Prorocentrum_lima.AAC.1
MMTTCNLAVPNEQGEPLVKQTRGRRGSLGSHKTCFWKQLSSNIFVNIAGISGAEHSTWRSRSCSKS